VQDLAPRPVRLRPLGEELGGIVELHRSVGVVEPLGERLQHPRAGHGRKRVEALAKRGQSPHEGVVVQRVDACDELVRQRGVRLEPGRGDEQGAGQSWRKLGAGFDPRADSRRECLTGLAFELDASGSRRALHQRRAIAGERVDGPPESSPTERVLAVLVQTHQLEQRVGVGGIGRARDPGQRAQRGGE